MLKNCKVANPGNTKGGNLNAACEKLKCTQMKQQKLLDGLYPMIIDEGITCSICGIT